MRSARPPGQRLKQGRGTGPHRGEVMTGAIGIGGGLPKSGQTGKAPPPLMSLVGGLRFAPLKDMAWAVWATRPCQPPPQAKKRPSFSVFMS